MEEKETNLRDDLVFASCEKVDLVAESALRGKKRGPEATKPKKPKSWEKMKPPYRVGILGFAYGNIPYVHEKVDPKVYLPLAYDLVKLILENGREISGWYDGTRWEGTRLRNRKVVWWRRELYDY